MTFKNLSTVMLICAFLIIGSVQAQDYGVADTVRFDIDTLVVNQSRHITVTIVNDYAIHAFDIAMWLEADVGWAIYDSLVWVGRMADPRVLGDRPFPTFIFDATPPDTFAFVGLSGPGSLDLPPGNTAVAELWVTGVDTGRIIAVDGQWPPANRNIFVYDDGGDTEPYMKGDTGVVIDGTPLPEITVEPAVEGIASQLITFDVAANSPVGYPVSLQLSSFAGYDDGAVLPQSSPSFNSAADTFNWTPSTSDVGIWRATIEACDSSGGCACADVMVQVAAGNDYLVDFNVSETPTALRYVTLEHVNLDSDAEPELFAGGTGVLYTDMFGTYDNVAGSPMSSLYTFNSNFPRRGYQLAYVNDDDYVDVVMSRFDFEAGEALKVQLGIPGGGFDTTNFSISTIIPRGSEMINYNNDQYLDFVSVGTALIVYNGGESPYFSEGLSTADSSISVNGADFNQDGYDDLAVGSGDFINIYLNNAGSGLTLHTQYQQEFGATDIDITNEGSDFNADGLFDLCVAAPSVGGEYSNIFIYIGDGLGGFTQSLVKRVKGQTVANRIGDINGDGHLDIVYMNATEKIWGILFGDGTGAFPSEQRLIIPAYRPYRVSIADYDLDGDQDIVVGSYNTNIDQETSLFFYENTLNPSGFVRTNMQLNSMNNASIEMTSPSGRVLNTISSTMPSGTYQRRSLDQDSQLDATTSLGVVESGAYSIKAVPQPGAARSETFTIEYSLDGQLYRLAKDASMRLEGYDFAMYPGGASEVLPVTGAFVYSTAPTLSWVGSGEFDIQIATDPAFTSILHSATVSDNSYSVPDPIAAMDTTIVYWRYKLSGQSGYDNLFALNVVPGGSGSCGDMNADGMVNVSDVTFFVAFLFSDGPSPVDSNLADVDSSGRMDISDLTVLISYLFRSGPPMNCPG